VGLIFTDRAGGYSPPPYDTLNLAYHTGDDPDKVRLNRRLVARELNIPAEHFVFLNQVHGVKVERASRNDLFGLPDPPYEAFKETDGVFTTQRFLVLCVLTADCLPLALAEEKTGMVAMLHAGWRGTFNNIAQEALKKMREELGISPADVRAVMGPGIGPCCYRVNKGRARMFVEKYGEKSGVVQGKEGYHLDLYRANGLNLIEAGVKENHIALAGGCSCCEARYFSFRREKVTGRQGAFIYRYG
jgi:YfiH family protein